MKKIYKMMIVYIYLPILIFILGWINILIAIPLVAVMFISLLFAIKSFEDKKLGDKEYKPTYITKYEYITEALIALCIFSAFFTFCGHNDLFPQDFDWHKHHAIFYDLMDKKWPVVYNQNNSLLTYYLGGYIIPSFIAKIFFGSRLVLKIAITLWNSVGMTLVYFFICEFIGIKRKQRMLILLFMLTFSGVTNLGSFIYVHIDGSRMVAFKWIDIYKIKVHFASNFDALRGAFQHVIAPWISCCLFLGNRRKYNIYVIIAIPLLFWATFGFFYLAIILLVYFIVDLIKSKKKLDVIKNAFSKENLLMLPIFAVIFVYLSGNIFAEKPINMGFKIYNPLDNVLFFSIFMLSEFVLYFIFLFKKNKNDHLYWICFSELFFVSIFSIGLYNDFCSRGSIPARFILMFFIIEQIYSWKIINWRNIATMILFGISLFNTIREFKYICNISKENYQNQTYICDNYKSFEGYAGNPNVREDEAYNYFTMNYEDSLFYKISRH